MGSSRTGGDGPEELEDLVERLLGRTQNAFELNDAVVRRLGAALMCHTEMTSCRQHSGPPRPMARRTLRHIFLLADGRSLVLYEVEHNTGEDDELLYEVYAEPEAMAHAQRVIDHRFGESAPAELEVSTAEWAELLPYLPDMPPLRKSYVEDNSAEHAWRVLRRAENEKTWPEAEVRRRLITARAHHISHPDRRQVGGLDAVRARVSAGGRGGGQSVGGGAHDDAGRGSGVRGVRGRGGRLRCGGPAAGGPVGRA